MPPKGHNSPHFSAHVYSGQTARWIEIPLGTDVGLGPGHILLDRDPTHPKTGTAVAPLFAPCLLWPDSSMDQDATWYGGIGLRQAIVC